jgi:hypothetical protein
VALGDRLAQAPVKFVDNRGPVGVFDDFFLEKCALRGAPEGGAVEGDAIVQRAVAGDKFFDRSFIAGQAKLGKEVVHGVLKGLHGKLLMTADG